MKERENLHKKLTKGDVNILKPEFDGKNIKASARACTLAHVTTALNVIGLLNCPITNCPVTNCPITTWYVNK